MSQVVSGELAYFAQAGGIRKTRSPVTPVAGRARYCRIAAGPVTPRYDVMIRNGTIYDGNGGKPYTADVAVSG